MNTDLEAHSNCALGIPCQAVLWPRFRKTWVKSFAAFKLHEPPCLGKVILHLLLFRLRRLLLRGLRAYWCLVWLRVAWCNWLLLRLCALLLDLFLLLVLLLLLHFLTLEFLKLLLFFFPDLRVQLFFSDDAVLRIGEVDIDVRVQVHLLDFFDFLLDLQVLLSLPSFNL